MEKEWVMLECIEGSLGNRHRGMADSVQGLIEQVSEQDRLIRELYVKFVGVEYNPVAVADAEMVPASAGEGVLTHHLDYLSRHISMLNYVHGLVAANSAKLQELLVMLLMEWNGPHEDEELIPSQVSRPTQRLSRAGRI